MQTVAHFCLGVQTVTQFFFSVQTGSVQIVAYFCLGVQTVTHFFFSVQTMALFRLWLISLSAHFCFSG